MRITERQAIEAVERLNEEYRAGSLNPPELNAHLVSLGAAPDTSVLDGYHPVDVGAFSGTAIVSGRRILEFRFNLHDASDNSFNLVEVRDLSQRQRADSRSPLIVALGLYDLLTAGQVHQ